MDTIWSALLHKNLLRDRSSGSMTDQIATCLVQAIKRRQIPAGTRLPPIRQLAKKLEIANVTVVNAYDRLIAQGLVQSKRGAGFYVSQFRDSPLVEAVLPVKKKGDQIGAGWLRQLVVQDVDGIHISEGGIPTEWFDEALVKTALRAVSQRKLSFLVTNGSPSGYLPLRESIQRQLLDLQIRASTSQILMTHGASQALYICACNLLEHRQTAFVDDPGFFKLYSFLRLQQVNVVGVPMQQDGPDIERMEQLLKIHRPKVFFTHSVLHTPTGAILSASKAHRLLQLAERYNFYVVEIDVNSHYQEVPSVRLTTLDQLQRVIYVGSFSKSIGLGLRVGYMVCPPQVFEDALNTRLILSTTSPALNERIIYQILHGGKFRSHLAVERTRLLQAGQRVQQLLEAHKFELFCPPQGGRFLWVKHPDYSNSNDLAERAAKAKIILAPGSAFRPYNEATPYFRINITLAEHPLLTKWLETF